MNVKRASFFILCLSLTPNTIQSAQAPANDMLGWAVIAVAGLGGGWIGYKISGKNYQKGKSDQAKIDRHRLAEEYSRGCREGRLEKEKEFRENAETNGVKDQRDLANLEALVNSIPHCANPEDALIYARGFSSLTPITACKERLENAQNMLTALRARKTINSTTLNSCAAKLGGIRALIGKIDHRHVQEEQEAHAKLKAQRERHEFDMGILREQQELQKKHQRVVNQREDEQHQLRQEQQRLINEREKAILQAAQNRERAEHKKDITLDMFQAYIRGHHDTSSQILDLAQQSKTALKTLQDDHKRTSGQLLAKTQHTDKEVENLKKDVVELTTKVGQLPQSIVLPPSDNTSIHAKLDGIATQLDTLAKQKAAKKKKAVQTPQATSTPIPYQGA